MRKYPAHWRGKQRLGQHFLMASEICQTIIEEAAIGPDDLIVEIGPGTGALTRFLDGKGKHLTLLEPDGSLAERLRAPFPKATIFGKKGEEADYLSLPGPLVVVGNLPYYASVPIFKRLTEQKENISRMVLMFQREVAQRIAASPGGRHYGSLSVWSGYHWTITSVVEVPPSAFEPPPKVFSTVLKFIPRPAPPVEGDPYELFRLVRASFTHKRRTLYNNLKGIYTPESVDAACHAAGIDRNARAETIGLEQFAGMLPLLHEGPEPLEPHS